MPGTRTTDTFSEGLKKLLGSITDLKVLDDSDMPFAINLETQVLAYLKQGTQQAMQPGQGPNPAIAQAFGPGGPGGPPGPMGGPGMGPGGPPGAGPAIGPAPVPGLMAGPSIPPVDELRRMLAQGNAPLRQNNVTGRL